MRARSYLSSVRYSAKFFESSLGAARNVSSTAADLSSSPNSRWYAATTNKYSKRFASGKAPARLFQFERCHQSRLIDDIKNLVRRHRERSSRERTPHRLMGGQVDGMYDGVCRDEYQIVRDQQISANQES